MIETGRTPRFVLSVCKSLRQRCKIEFKHNFMLEGYVYLLGTKSSLIFTYTLHVCIGGMHLSIH